MTLEELRKQSGMSRAAFAEYFGLPYRSLQNWELGLRKCPDYLLNLIQYKLEKERGAAVHCHSCGHEIKYCPNCGREIK